MKREFNRIHQADCIQALQQLSPGSIDLAFADPPFNIGYDYDVYDDQRSDVDYLGWCRKWMEGVSSALKDDGTFWLAIGDEYAAELKVLAQSLGFKCRSWVIWYYTFGVNCRNGFSRSHTHLFHFVKDAANYTFNGDNPAVRVPSARQLVYADARADPRGRLPDNTWILRPQDGPLHSFTTDQDTWYFARVAGTFKEREGFHGCQMPEQLLGRVIRVSSNPGEVVLDPFGGSGTTLTVAKKMGRRWIGFELSDEYVRHITGRLESAQCGDPLDGPEDPLRSAPTTKKSRARQLSRNKDVSAERAQIVDAYTSIASDYSIDQLLSDPDRNRLFVDACQKQELKGSAAYFNRQLLMARKAGALPKRTGKATRRDNRTMDSYSFASEIAMQRLQIEYDKTLDELLCNPETAEAFDRVAESFAPGFTSYQYRWAALSLRKRAKQAKQWAAQEFSQWLDDELPRARAFPKCISSLPSQAGVYVVSRQRQALYVGETADLKQRLQHLCDHIEPWEFLEPTSVKWIACDQHRAGLQSALVQRLRPMLNSRLLYASKPAAVSANS